MDDSTNSNNIKLLGIFLIFMGLYLTTVSPAAGLGSSHQVEYVPVLNQSVKTFNTVTDTQRRRLAPYQLCLLCKCCSATTCTSMPCCFAIDCQLPNKPFGVCAFVPKTCNCANCATSV